MEFHQRGIPFFLQTQEIEVGTLSVQNELLRKSPVGGVSGPLFERYWVDLVDVDVLLSLESFMGKAEPVFQASVCVCVFRWLVIHMLSNRSFFLSILQTNRMDSQLCRCLFPFNPCLTIES